MCDSVLIDACGGDKTIQMTDAILVLNAGSSSLKFSIFRDGEQPELLVRGQIAGLQTGPRFVATGADGNVVSEYSWPEDSVLSHQHTIEFLLDWGKNYGDETFRVIAAGHRVVHGGAKFKQPIRIDEKNLDELEKLVPLAPLHQPHNLAAIRALTKHAPQLPQVACFDTSFHRSQPGVAQQFALPRELTATGLQRYGFHGLSYEYIASRLPHFDSRAAAGRTIVAHLGNGASLCALDAGVSVATTMGFTPLDGLVMGTRCGAIDPGVVLYLINERGMSANEVDHLLTYESGLLGVSGRTSDMRWLLDHESADTRAAEAIELFVYRLAREIGSMAAALGGFDALVFTGGIGENAPAIRTRACQAVKWLGVDCDEERNNQGGPRISGDNSRVAAWAIPTNEELMIAQHVKDVLNGKAT